METNFAVRPRRVVAMLFGVMAIFAAINVSLAAWLSFGLYGYTPVFFLRPFFDLDAEKNIPTLVEVGLLLASSGLLALVALRARAAADGLAAGWWILAGGFVLLAVDEGWSIHEQLLEPSSRALGGTLPPFLAISWVVPGLAGVAVVLGILLRFLLRLPRPLALRLVGAGAVFIGGCIGMEMVGAAYIHHARHITLTYDLIATIEESMEMSGVILLIRALLAELSGGAEVLHVALALHGRAPNTAEVNDPLPHRPVAPRGRPAA